MRLKPKNGQPGESGSFGFTLLELLIVLFILGLIAALAIPAMGVLDNAERSRITRERMDLIRRAILGPDNCFDSKGRPIIGGYVGDMKAWPDLWEPRAEIKPNFSGTGWASPMSMTAGLGQGPSYTLNPSHVFFRPSGHFVKGRWQWNLPYRKLYDDTGAADHAGGLTTENEGQPRGLWTRFPEDLTADLPGHPAPGEDLGDNWKGPYIFKPIKENPSDSDHWASTDDEYEALEPIWHTSGTHANYNTWEEGHYNPAAELGENFDDKEAFRTLQNEGRLTDGWDRAFRFFITPDPDYAGGTIFWILSEGPDGEGVYPNKGDCSGHVWTVDAGDTMASNYDETAPKNKDNILLKLYSRDWQVIFDAEHKEKEKQTDEMLARIKEALIGDSPDNLNTGFTGDITRLPRLFRWETSFWDDEDASNTAYTKGQPRGLWTDKPNSSDPSDDINGSSWGVGRRHGYIKTPQGAEEQNILTDAWDRKILFFRDDANDMLLILSRGADGKFDFGTVNAAGTEPLGFIEAVDATAYNPAAATNIDNRILVVSLKDWHPGFFRLLQVTVTNAFLNDPAQGTTKARFFRADGVPVAGIDLLVPTILTDEDGDAFLDDWSAGDGTAVNPAFNYDDVSAQKAFTGARYMVVWNDSNGNDDIDSGENCYSIIYNVTAAAGTGQYGAVTVDTGDFRALP